jgi:hypothetical protein
LSNRIVGILKLLAIWARRVYEQAFYGRNFPCFALDKPWMMHYKTHAAPHRDNDFCRGNFFLAIAKFLRYKSRLVLA